MWPLIAAAVFASATSHENRDEERGLTREQVAHYAGAYRPAILACYADNAHSRRATGKLTLQATVLRGGAVIGLTIDAPGVTGIELALLTNCVRKEVDTWHFPVRRDDTMIVIPYYFQKTYAPKAGPQYSCWNPRGCKR